MLVLNMAGLLTCVLLSTFPPWSRAVVFWSNNSHPLRNGPSLQLREQYRIHTEFPFNPILSTKEDRNQYSMRSYYLIFNFKYYFKV